MAPDATPVASSATDTAPPVVTGVDHAVASGDVSAFREARRAERSGTPLDVPAASSPAQPGDQVASTDASASAASEPAKAKKVNNADTRVQELLAERESLRAELDTLKRPKPSDAMPAASSPATVAVSEDFPEFDAWLATPGNDGKSYTEYQRAFVRHEFAQVQQAARTKDAEAIAQREQDERIAAYYKSAETFIADHADYWEFVNPVTGTRDQPIQATPIRNALGEVIQRSANAPALLYHLGHDFPTWQRLLSLPIHLAASELGKIDAALSAPEKPKPQSLTRAKEPPTTLGRRSADPTDALEAAVANDDVAAYREAKLRARTAAAR